MRDDVDGAGNSHLRVRELGRPTLVGLTMRRFTYRKLDLNQVPAKSTDIDLLNAAGQEGWDLVCIILGVAYMRREIVEDQQPPRRRAAK